ncbi:hypothetical protein J3F83DRAFT_733936 [Trichoderma novae-zelandiae]
MARSPTLVFGPLCNRKHEMGQIRYLRLPECQRSELERTVHASIRKSLSFMHHDRGIGVMGQQSATTRTCLQVFQHNTCTLYVMPSSLCWSSPSQRCLAAAAAVAAAARLQASGTTTPCPCCSISPPPSLSLCSQSAGFSTRSQPTAYIHTTTEYGQHFHVIEVRRTTQSRRSLHLLVPPPARFLAVCAGSCWILSPLLVLPYM